MHFFRDFLVTLRISLRAKFSWVILCIFLACALGTLLSAYFGGRQPAVVALDVGVSIIRLLMPFLIVMLVQELFFNEFDRRYYLASLTYPRGRCNLLLGRFFAFLWVLIFVLLVVGVLQFGLVVFIDAIYPRSAPAVYGHYYLIVFSFIALDLLVLMALATLLAVVASTPSFVLIGTLGFMLVSRSYGDIVDLLGRDAGLVANSEAYRESLGVLGYLLPDLGALDLRMLVLYGRPEFLPVDWPWLLLSSLGYAVGLLALAVWALQRKRFA